MVDSIDHLPLIERFAALSDAARLRVLRLLDKEELSVGELAKALQLPQSTVSRHLKLLHDGGWITKRSAGTASLYRLAEQSHEPSMRDLWKLVRAQMGVTSMMEHDDARLREVLAERRVDSKSFFGQIGSEWDALRRDLFGDTFTADALLHLIPQDIVVADIGCGTGNASELLAPLVKKIIAIDREPAMIQAARKRLAIFQNIEFRQGDLSELPLKKNEIDAAVMMLVLVHNESPAVALAEIARTLKSGGLVLVVDLISHHRENYRHTLGHKHLGFDEARMRSLAQLAGLTVIRHRQLRPHIDARGAGLFVAALKKP